MEFWDDSIPLWREIFFASPLLHILTYYTVRALVQKLKAAGTPVTYHVYAGEEHGLRRVKRETEPEIVAFFEKWLKK